MPHTWFCLECFLFLDRFLLVTNPKHSFLRRCQLKKRRYLFLFMDAFCPFNQLPRGKRMMLPKPLKCSILSPQKSFPTRRFCTGSSLAGGIEAPLFFLGEGETVLSRCPKSTASPSPFPSHPFPTRSVTTQCF